MIREVQRHIDTINQKEAFNSDDSTRQLVNDAMQDITFNFSKIGEDEMQLISGGVELQEKWQRAIHAFTQNIDQEDPEFVTLREAFMHRFKEHGFVVDTIDEFNEHSRALDEILKKLAELQKRNKALMRKYSDDAKFARVHKRVKEENSRRRAAGLEPIVSDYDEDIMDVLRSIKADVDQKVYDRNDILKKDAYFEQTVMTLVKSGMDRLSLKSSREDRLFIQSRITGQYLSQYNATYPAA
jgi:type I restriction enzyme R subunit